MEKIPPPPHIAAIILAAGASSRMGEPKPLLLFRGESLLRRAVRAAVAAQCAPIVVVLGAHADACRETLAGFPVQTAFNKKWSDGLGSSLRVGLEATLRCAPDAYGVFALLCDQPLVDASLLETMMRALELHDRPAVACSYQGSFGAPALFRRDFFPHLADLRGDAGARHILQRHADSVAIVPFPHGATDIDTPDEYRRLLQLETENEYAE